MPETPAPLHVAFIMDGNRRFQLVKGEGLYQDAAINAVMAAVEECLARGVLQVSFYAYSLENYQKRECLVRGMVFDAVLSVCQAYEDFFLKQQVRVRFFGKRAWYPAPLLAAVQALEVSTQNCQAMTVSIFLCYGGRQEIVEAVQAVARQCVAGAYEITGITTGLFEQHLQTKGLLPLDLIVRTGGNHRLSNFMLYQAAYSELLFLNELWPEVTRGVVAQCLAWFAEQKRNFGA